RPSASNPPSDCETVNPRSSSPDVTAQQRPRQKPRHHHSRRDPVLRLLRDEGLILPAAYQRERRQLAARRKASFATEPTGPNQVWQLDFSEFETTTGGTWRIAGCRDYWSKYEHPWHVSPT